MSDKTPNLLIQNVCNDPSHAFHSMDCGPDLEKVSDLTRYATHTEILEAARLVADPMDELWFCKAHGYAIDRFDGLTPKECLYVGRPGDCEPVAALVIAAALTPGDTNG